jgi:hypothetical protein
MSGINRPPAATAAHGAVQFEYVGRSAITAIGPATGRRYCFTAPGARVVVDLRDRHALASVPHLRQMRG